MKNLLTIILLCVSSICFSQDTLQIPQVELDEFFLALDTLEVQDSIKTVLIISFKNQEIILLNDQINLHLDRLNQVDKWYKKPWVGFVGGVAGTIILIHTIDYTLPQ